MHFTRIKVTDKVVELDWSELLPNGEKKSISLESPNRPLPALLAAMAALRDYVVELLELPSTWLDELRITTINIDEGKDGRRGLIVTCLRPIAKAAKRPLVMNTPQMREPNSEEDVEMFLPDEILTLVKRAEVAAMAFVNGEREQTELPLGTAPVTAPAEKKRRGKKGDFIPEVGALNNPDATEILSDEDIRSRLLARGRDVPPEAIGRWVATERDGVIRWLDTIETLGGDEPSVLKRDATPSLFDEHIERTEGWTQETPPPKASEIEPPVAS